MDVARRLKCLFFIIKKLILSTALLTLRGGFFYLGYKRGFTNLSSSLQELCEKENIKLASVSAIGALNAFTAGVYMVDEKRYVKNEFKGCFEIVSLTGTVNTKGGKYYSHLHISAGDESGRVFGGHLNEAHISATAEVVIRMINGEVDRFYDDATGLNLFKF